MDPFDLRLWPGFVSSGGNPELPAVIDQVSIDSRRIDSRNALFVPLVGTQSDGHQFIPQAIQAGARYVLVRNDWVPPQQFENVTFLKVENTLFAFQDIAKAYRKQLPTKFVAIAGSYGKTMVKDLLQALIASSKNVAASPESFNSQIGAALSLFTVNKSHEIALIEAGISKKYEMDRLTEMISPDHSIITHVGKKHLATLGDMQTIADELIKLSKCSTEGWTLIPQSPLLQKHNDTLSKTLFYWNVPSSQLPHAVALKDQHGAHMPYRIDFPDGSQYHSEATFGFYYFLDLINITVKAAWLLGVTSEAIKKTLSHYTAEPMRTEIWRSPIGTTFINETYCSDPQSVSRALHHFDQISNNGRKVFVFGGLRGKQQHVEIDYRHVGENLTRTKIDLLLLVGKHPFDTLLKEVNRNSPTTQVLHCHTHEDAIQAMRPWVRQDDVVMIKGEKKEPLDALTVAFNDSICTNQCFINLAAIESNIASIRGKLASGSRIMVIVKALAYGTNDIRMGKFLATCGVDVLGVSYVDEGVALKRAGIQQAIFVISAANYEAAKVVKWGLEVGVSEKSFIEALAKEAKEYRKTVKVHLHVDTGMSRFGCRPEEALGLAKLIKSHPELLLEGIMTHFASADDPKSDAFTLEQAAKFDQVIKELENENIYIPWHHASNSSGVLRFHFPQFNMVRIGLAVYGLYPSEACKKDLDLRLAISLVSRIVGINTCQAGETISYGRSYVVKRDHQRIAVLPIGYFDGLHRTYSGKSSVVIRGQKAPMVGKICMDFMMVDITDIPSAAIGDSVLIFGEDEHGHYVSPEDLASRGDSIVYELITCLGPRIQRIFIHEEAHQLR